MKQISIGSRLVGRGHPVYVVAEISANHNGSFDQAVEIVRAAKVAGADAVKLQTYTADTITIDSDTPDFRVGEGTLWAGRKLYELYQEAYTPWEWQPRLCREAQELGLDFFSTAFDPSAVEFLETMQVPVHKTASFEITDIPLIRKMAETGKPVIISTGMATVEEIHEAIEAVYSTGNKSVMILKCTSAYPANAGAMNLRTIPDMRERFDVEIGLSDHSPGHAVAVASVALGACMIEKHLTISRAQGGPDSAFSLEPSEFALLVSSVREAEVALGGIVYGGTAAEEVTKNLRRSLYAVDDIPAGCVFSRDNVRSVRPGYGLHPRFLPVITGRRAVRRINKGERIAWDMIDGGKP